MVRGTTLASHRFVSLEHLESRTHFDGASFTNVDITRTDGNEAEGAIAVDKTNPQRLFALTNTDPNQAGLHAAYSSDGGATWTQRVIAGGSDSLEEACCDPSCAFDSFGNLFISYISLKDASNVELAMSTDGGVTFTPLTEIGGHDDQPTLTVGPGSLWITYARSGTAVANGAAVSGLGQVGAFGPVERIRGNNGGTFGDIAIGPDGQVAVTYQKPKAGRYSTIGISVDPDGLGPAGFRKPTIATTTGVGLFASIDAQASRGIDAEAGLAYDRSQGAFRGRLYLVYSDTVPKAVNLVDTFARYSDNGGITWSNPARINDDINALNSHFLPRIATDDTTGDVAVSWYDTRDDPGNTPVGRAAATERRRTLKRPKGEEEEHGHDDGDKGGGGDTGTPSPSVIPSAFADDDVAYYCALVRPTVTGLLVGANSRVSAGLSNAFNANNQIDLGDYTGLDFYNGILHPLWADNSNTTSDNPNGASMELDQYTASVTASALPVPDRVALGGQPVVPGPAAMYAVKGYSAANPRGFFTFPVTYVAGPGVDTSTLIGTELTITGPGGFQQPGQITKIKRGKTGVSVTAMYIVANPNGRWRSTEAGIYTIAVTGTVKDLLGNVAPTGPIGNFVVIA